MVIHGNEYHAILEMKRYSREITPKERVEEGFIYESLK
jgi:hypothetical protein